MGKQLNNEKRAQKNNKIKEFGFNASQVCLMLIANVCILMPQTKMGNMVNFKALLHRIELKFSELWPANIALVTCAFKAKHQQVSIVIVGMLQ